MKLYSVPIVVAIAGIAVGQQHSSFAVTEVTTAVFFRNSEPLNLSIVKFGHGFTLWVNAWNKPNPRIWLDATQYTAHFGGSSCDFGLTCVRLGDRTLGGVFISPRLALGKLRVTGIGYYQVNDLHETNFFVPYARLFYGVRHLNLGAELAGSSDSTGWHQRVGPMFQWDISKTQMVRFSNLSASGDHEARVFYVVKF